MQCGPRLCQLDKVAILASMFPTFLEQAHLHALFMVKCGFSQLSIDSGGFNFCLWSWQEGFGNQGSMACLAPLAVTECVQAMLTPLSGQFFTSI